MLGNTHHRGDIYSTGLHKDTKSTFSGHFREESQNGLNELPMVKTARDGPYNLSKIIEQGKTKGSSLYNQSFKAGSSLEKTNSSLMMQTAAKTTMNGFEKARKQDIDQENIRLARRIATVKSGLNKDTLGKEVSKVMTYKAMQTKLNQEGKQSFATKMVESLSKMDYPPRFKKRYIQGASFKEVSIYQTR